MRDAIESKISSGRRRAKDREKIRWALKAQDRIAETLARRYAGSWKGTEVIRYWRNTAIRVSAISGEFPLAAILLVLGGLTMGKAVGIIVLPVEDDL